VDDNFELHLADFGFATIGLDEKGRLKKLNEFLGSMAYAAPEMFIGDPYSGVATDIF
jgi:serine/threonine protein kinase